MERNKLLQNNKTLQILQAAEEGNYGVVAAVAYNIEHVIAYVKAAEAKRAPLMILFFPWAVKFSDGLLVRCAADAARRATVPVSVHLDHAQDEEQIKSIADDRGKYPFDSIMVDMSHFDKPENLRKTHELVEYCQAHGIATEAEPGRIEGGEDGIGDTANLKGLETTVEEAGEFIDTGVDMLAPAIGNVHGEYGPAGPQLDFERLEQLHKLCRARGVRLVLHGTNSFDEDLTWRCVTGGMRKLNVNKLVLEDYLDYVTVAAEGVPLTELMEKGVGKVQSKVEWMMDVSRSTGKG